MDKRQRHEIKRKEIRRLNRYIGRLESEKKEPSNGLKIKVLSLKGIFRKKPDNLCTKNKSKNYLEEQWSRFREGANIKGLWD